VRCVCSALLGHANTSARRITHIARVHVQAEERCAAAEAATAAVEEASGELEAANAELRERLAAAVAVGEKLQEMVFQLHYQLEESRTGASAARQALPRTEEETAVQPTAEEPSPAAAELTAAAASTTVTPHKNRPTNAQLARRRALDAHERAGVQPTTLAEDPAAAAAAVARPNTVPTKRGRVSPKAQAEAGVHHTASAEPTASDVTVEWRQSVQSDADSVDISSATAERQRAARSNSGGTTGRALDEVARNVTTAMLHSVEDNIFMEIAAEVYAEDLEEDEGSDDYPRRNILGLEMYESDEEEAQVNPELARQVAAWMSQDTFQRFHIREINAASGTGGQEQEEAREALRRDAVLVVSDDDSEEEEAAPVQRAAHSSVSKAKRKAAEVDSSEDEEEEAAPVQRAAPSSVSVVKRRKVALVISDSEEEEEEEAAAEEEMLQKLEIVLKALEGVDEKPAIKRERSWAVRLVCSGWRRVHDKLLSHLVLKPTPDTPLCMLVRRFPAVVSLELKGHTEKTALTDEGLRAVTSSLPALTCLNLTYCSNVTDEGMQVVSTLPALTSLNLSRCYKLKDEGVKAVSNLPALTSLNLFCCSKVTAVGMQAVSSLPALRWLNLSHCNNMVTDDDALLAVRSMHSLTFLNLRHCSKVTATGVQALRTAAPSLHIDSNYE
jgi:hypothetical protein